ncbi:MAG: CRISPR-associated endonuclease Cas1 [Armatimonadota bacterium]
MFADGLDYLPVSSLAEIAYCPRNFYYRVIEQLDDGNVHTLQGALDEEKRARRPQVQREHGVQVRSELVSSDELGLIAVVDAVEEGDQLIPIEYKSGHLKESRSDDLQLCAEAMILEDALDVHLAYGFLYYTAARRRRRVDFTPELRAAVRDLMRQAWEILHTGRAPDPVADERCQGCSLRPACLPEETLSLEGERRPPAAPGIPERLGRTVVIDEQGAYLRRRKGEIVVMVKRDEIAAIPAQEIDSLVLVGPVQLSPQLLRLLLDANVEVHYLSSYGRYQGRFVPEWHKNVHLRLSQTALHFDEGRCLQIAREMVRGKLHNMRSILRRAARDGDDHDLTTAADEVHSVMRRVDRADDRERLRALEGQGAAAYFRVFGRLLGGPTPEFDFAGRSRRPPRDPVNALLGFAYAMLTSEMITALSVAGLDPYIGFFHATRYGRPALALDLMEEFRPIVADSVVRRLVNTGMVKPGHFQRRLGGCFLTERGRAAFFQEWDRRKRQPVTHPVFKYTLAYGRMFELQARILSKVITGDLERYTPLTVY